MRNDSQGSGVRGQAAGIRRQKTEDRSLYGKAFIDEDGQLCRYATRRECVCISLIGWAVFLSLCVVLRISITALQNCLTNKKGNLMFHISRTIAFIACLYIVVFVDAKIGCAALLVAFGMIPNPQRKK